MNGRIYITMCIGELIGTFLLVFFGIASVAVAVLFNGSTEPLQIGIIWGIGVTLSIYATRHLSCAHLNPAVSFAMVLTRRMDIKLLPGYWISQLCGAILAGAVVLLIFNTPLYHFEAGHNIIRGASESIRTAKIFGEYFQSLTTGTSVFSISFGTAVLVEAIGTFLLVMMIFCLTEGCNVSRPSDYVTPVFIGATVTAIISILSPLTQAGLNPARDFGPRLVAYLGGWKSVAIPGPQTGFLAYIIGPLIGSAAAALCFKYIYSNLAEKHECNLCKGSSSLSLIKKDLNAMK